MKPIMLQGHERALTQVKYNLDGDLLFSVSKDPTPSVWFSHNGERLGTYEGHNGTVWCVDVDYTSTRLVTGAADCKLKIWDVETGKELFSLENKSPVRTCGYSYDGKKVFYTTDANMGQQCKVFVYSVDSLLQQGASAKPDLEFTDLPTKVTSALWGLLDETIVTGHENGLIATWDAKTGAQINKVAEHTKAINDLQWSKDQTMFISASKDFTSKLFDGQSLELIKEFKTERPVNSASISPLKEHVVLGGGQDAMSVTTTHGKAGKFEARFFHAIFEEEIGAVKGHFGPINTLAFHPEGTGYASGGEDGYVRLHKFDPNYLDYDIEY